MRVNLNSANSASKNLPSAPVDHVGSDPAFSFFAQIDQIQNFQNNRDRRPDANSQDKDPDNKSGNPNFLSTLLSSAPQPPGPFPMPGYPAGSPTNEVCQSSGSDGTLPDSLSTAVAQSMAGGSFAALFPGQMQDSENPQTGTQSSQQTFDTFISPQRNDSPSAPQGPGQGIKLTLQANTPAEAADAQNASLQSLSNEIAQILEKSMKPSGAPAVEGMKEQNASTQQLSNEIARILQRTTDSSGTQAAGGMNGQNPPSQLLSNQIAQILERTMNRPGAQTAGRADGQSPSTQLLSKAIAQILEGATGPSVALAATNTIAELGVRSQSDPQKTRAYESRQPGSIPPDSETRTLFSKIATISAPDKSSDAVNSSGTAEVPDTQVKGNGTTAPIKVNAPVAPQNDRGAESQTNSHSDSNELGAATIAQGKSNAFQTEISLAKTGTSGNRQEISSRDFSTNAPLMDSPLKPASSAASEPAKPQNLVLQIADRIQIQLRDGGGEIRIQLKPDGLGQLEIKAETTANGVTARISTDSDGVKSYLENNLHLLQQTLQDQGLKVDRIFVTIQNGSDNQSSSSYTAHFGHSGQGQHGRESHSSQREPQIDGSDALEEMTVDQATWLALRPKTRFYTVA